MIKLKEYIESLDKVLSQGTNRERREFIRTFIRRMEFDPVSKSITIYWYSDPIQAQKKFLYEPESVGVLTGVGRGTRTPTGVAHMSLKHARLPVPPPRHLIIMQKTL